MRDEAPGTEETSQFKAFVGGLSYQITDADLKAAFDRYDCSSAKIMTEKFTGRPRGFGFVWFKDEAGMKEAIEQMHNKVSTSKDHTECSTSARAGRQRIWTRP